jgi:beta-lactam-binding protein with PASTA domain
VARGTWAGGAFILLDDEALVSVPDVVGDDQATGTATLEGAGFVVQVVTTYSATVAAGDIISQSPSAGTDAEDGSTVTITVSLGPASGAGGSTIILARRRGRR